MRDTYDFSNARPNPYLSPHPGADIGPQPMPEPTVPPSPGPLDSAPGFGEEPPPTHITPRSAAGAWIKRSAPPLLLLLLGACSPPDGTLYRSQITAGPWLLDGEALPETACTQTFPGGPGSSLIMTNPLGAQDFREPFPATLDLIDPDGAPTSVSMSCATAEALEGAYEDRHKVVCEGTTEFYLRPDPAVDARWRLHVTMAASFNWEAFCSDEAHRLDYTGFGEGGWTVLYEAPCLGEDCGLTPLPTDVQGNPQCIQGLAIEARWEGCEASEVACRPLGSDPWAECP